MSSTAHLHKNYSKLQVKTHQFKKTQRVRPEIFSEYSVFLLPYAVADKNCMQSCLCVVMLGTAASFQLLHAGGTSTPAKKFYSVSVCSMQAFSQLTVKPFPCSNSIWDLLEVTPPPGKLRFFQVCFCCLTTFDDFMMSHVSLLIYPNDFDKDVMLILIYRLSKDCISAHEASRKYFVKYNQSNRSSSIFKPAVIQGLLIVIEF